LAEPSLLSQLLPAGEGFEGVGVGVGATSWMANARMLLPVAMANDLSRPPAPSGVCLAFGRSPCDKIMSHRQAADPFRLQYETGFYA
jgi:hypothetical protein